MSENTDAVEGDVVEPFVLEINPFDGSRSLLFQVPPETRSVAILPDPPS